MKYAPEGEKAQARVMDGVEESPEAGSVLDYLWSGPEEVQAPLQACAEESAILVPPQSAGPQAGKDAREEGKLSSVLNNYNGWLNTIAEA